MRRGPLHIEQTSVACARRTPEGLDQGDECHLRRVALTVEHRLPGKQSAYLDAVEPSDELFAVPDLDGVRPAESMQFAVRRAEGGRDPAVRALRIAAAGHDVIKGDIDGRAQSPT